MLRRASHVLLLVGPASLFSFAFVAVPIGVGIALSVFDFADGVPRYVGLGNFATVLSAARFWWTLSVTILWTVSNLALHVVLGIAFALLLVNKWLFARGWFRALLVLPWAVPSYISALSFRGLFDVERGALNNLLKMVGAEPVDWYARFATSFATNLTTNAWLGFPFIMVITLGALQTVPKEQIEAMQLDGATAWQKFRHLTWPTIAPVLAPALTLSAAWTFNMFNVVYLVSGGAPRGETDILVSEAYRWAFERGHRYGLAAAYCLLIALMLWGFAKLARRQQVSA